MKKILCVCVCLLYFPGSASASSQLPKGFVLDPPSQQQQINELVKQNNALRSQLAQLQNKGSAIQDMQLMDQMESNYQQTQMNYNLENINGNLEMMRRGY